MKNNEAKEYLDWFVASINETYGINLALEQNKDGWFYLLDKNREPTARVDCDTMNNSKMDSILEVIQFALRAKEES